MAEKKVPEKVVVVTQPPVTPSPEKVEEAPVRRSDETVPGGRYIVNGVLVNCNGEPIKE